MNGRMAVSKPIDQAVQANPGLNIRWQCGNLGIAREVGDHPAEH
jgi:hypothetical protein